MQHTRNTLLLASLLSAALAAGCARPTPRAAEAREPWTGETEPMEVVVDAINRNNARLETLWAQHYYEANVVDEEQQTHFVNGLGGLLYKQPMGMLLRGNKEGINGPAFEVGSTDDYFWLTMKPGPAEPRKMWWGAHENIGKPCAQGLQDVPIRPDMMLAVLGVGVIGTNFMEPPVPVMRFNNDADVYMFVWNAPRPELGKWVAVKEIWYDRQTYRPVRVFLHDEDGRVVVRARLSNHEPVPTRGESEGDGPVIATDYRLYFPDSGTTMSFELRDLTPDKNGIPTRRGIAFDPRTAAKRAQEVVRIDEGCVD